MFRLKTFGGIWLEDASAAPVAAPTQRRLAVLAIVAAGGRRGVSRDRLLGLLWPESNQERARHALSQVLYSLRRDLGAEPIAGTTELRLNPEVISSDIGDFLTAVERGDDRAVARLSERGFLDGYFLSGSAPFSAWVDEQRTAIGSASRRALESLAIGAEAAGDHREAVNRWRQLTGLDPFSGHHAARLMRALSAAGDRAAALSHAREYESLVWRELEAPPDDEVVKLATEYRVGTPPPSPDRNAPGPVVPDAGEAHPVSSSRPARRRWRIAMVAAVVGVGAVAVWASIEPGAGSSARDRPILLVGRISDRAGGDSGSSAGVMTDMLSTGLGGIPGLAVVANSRVLEIIKPGQETEPAAFTAAAARAGATTVLEGEVTWAEAGGLSLTLRRVDVRSGLVENGYRVTALDRFGLVDSAVAAVARDLGAGAAPAGITEATTASAIAYRFYEEGLRAFYQYDLAAASRLMDLALLEDSSFALAAYYAWRSEPGELRKVERGRRALRLANRLPSGYRLMIEARIRVAYDDPLGVAQAETLAVRFPTDPEAWMTHALATSATGDYSAAVAAFDRAIALDSALGPRETGVCRLCDALSGLGWTYLSWDSAAAAERTGRRWLGLRGSDLSAHGHLAWWLIAQGRFAEARGQWRIADSLRGNLPADFEGPLRALLLENRYPEFEAMARPLLESLDHRLRQSAEWLHLIALRNQGRYGEATAFQRERRPNDRFSAGVLAFETGDYPEAVSQFRALAAAAARDDLPGRRARNVGWLLTLAGMAHAAAGDLPVVSRLADSVETLASETVFGRNAGLPFYLRGLVLAREGRHTEAADLFSRASSSWTLGFTRINYELAHCLIATGRPGEAIRPLQAALRGGLDGSNFYVTRTELHRLLAQAFDRSGRPDSAAAHRRAVAAAAPPNVGPRDAPRGTGSRWPGRRPGR